MRRMDTPQQPQQRASVGRTVHYRLAGTGTGGEPDVTARPATIVHDNGGSVNLQVLLDGTNDALPQYGRHVSEAEARRGLAWRTSVVYSEEPKPNTWGWPPRV